MRVDTQEEYDKLKQMLRRLFEGISIREIGAKLEFPAYVYSTYTCGDEYNVDEITLSIVPEFVSGALKRKEQNNENKKS